MDGYYDHHPLLVLSRPVTLVGVPGSGVVRVGHALTSQTGLPLNDVDRLIESRAGKSLRQVRIEDGAEVLRGLEAEVVDRALLRRPCGVIVLRSETLADGAIRARVLEGSCLVALERSRDVLEHRLRSQNGRGRDSMEIADLDEALAAGAPVMSTAHVLFDAGDRHPQRLADELQASLDRIVGLESGASVPA